MRVHWNDDNTLSLEEPQRPKKMTATRFAAVLGLNRWVTPFQTWCEMTRAWCKPYEETAQTRAGKAIEPRQIAYMRRSYGMDDLLDPTDVYGPDYFERTHGDFFSHPVLGGMWDAITRDAQGRTTSVLEFKTTQRAEDWVRGIPTYYALQAALYAWLLPCDRVIVVVTFLQPRDYARPGELVVNAANTATCEFCLKERYPTFERTYVRPALAWWQRHIASGVSPAYDERRDAEYLRGLRTTTLNPTTDVNALMDEFAALSDQVKAHDQAMSATRKRMQAIRQLLRNYAQDHLGDAMYATLSQGRVSCKLARTAHHSIDEDALRRDGLYERYALQDERMRFEVTVAPEST